MRTALRLATAIALLVVACFVGTAAGQTSDLGETPLIMTLAELEEEIQRREEDLRRYNARLEELESRNAEIREELERRAAELRAREHDVRGRVVTLCRLRRGGAIQWLRGARTWADLVRRARVARAIVDGDVAVLREHQQRVERLAERRAELEESLRTTRELRARIAQYQQELEQERQRRLRRQAEPGFPQSHLFEAPDERPSSLPPFEY